MHRLQNSISLWSGLVFHKSHRVGEQFCLSFSFFAAFVVIVVAVVRNRFIGATVFVSKTALSTVSLFLLFLQLTTLISVMCRFFYSGGTSFWVCRFNVGGMLAHRVDLHLIMSF